MLLLTKAVSLYLRLFMRPNHYMKAWINMNTQISQNMTNPYVTGGRLSLFIIVFWFLMGGIHTPFWQSWLEMKGLNALQVAVLLGIAPLSRPITGVFVSWIADTIGNRKYLIVGLSFAAALVFSLFAITDNYWLWLVITFVWAQLIWTASSLLTSMITIATQNKTQKRFLWVDSLIYLALTVIAVYLLNMYLLQKQQAQPLSYIIIIVVAFCGLYTLLNNLRDLDYGRLRLWGSIGAITAINIIGFYLYHPEFNGVGILLWIMITGTLSLGIIALFLPNIQSHYTEHKQMPALALLKRRSVFLLLLIAVLLQSSHGMLYAQGTNYWSNQGIGYDIIAKFWTLGNIAELIFFSIGWIFRKYLRASHILIVTGLVASLRWLLMSFFGDVPNFVFFIMMLHGFTYSLGHLGAMYWVENHIEQNFTASMQSLYTSFVFGVGLGLSMILSGFVTQYFGATLSWLMMSLMGLSSMVIAIFLSKLPKPHKVL